MWRESSGSRLACHSLAGGEDRGGRSVGQLTYCQKKRKEMSLIRLGGGRLGGTSKSGWGKITQPTNTSAPGMGRWSSEGGGGGRTRGKISKGTNLSRFRKGTIRHWETQKAFSGVEEDSVPGKKNRGRCHGVLGKKGGEQTHLVHLSVGQRICGGFRPRISCSARMGGKWTGLGDDKTRERQAGTWQPKGMWC